MVKLLPFLMLFGLFSANLKAQTRTLEEYLSQGVKNSPLLKDYQNQISSADLDSLLVTASQKPQVDANAQLMYAPYLSNFGYDDVITNGGNYAATLSVSQYFLNRNVLTNKYQSIRTQKRSVANQKKVSESDLRRTITNQYLSSFSDFTDLAFNRSFLRLMNEEKNLLNTLVEHGIYKQTDFLSLLIEIQSQEFLILQLENQVKKDLRLLNQVCGMTDTLVEKLESPVITMNGVQHISQSPLFLQYQIDSLKINNDKSAIGLRYKPKLNWFSDAGLMSSTPQNFYRHFGFSVGINLTVPIYDGHQRKYETKKLEIQEDSRSSYQQFFVHQYDQQLKQLNEELASLNQLEIQLKKQANSASELMTMAKSQLNAGNIPMTDFINAVKNYLGINHALHQNKIKEYLVINEINYLLQK